MSWSVLRWHNCLMRRCGAIRHLQKLIATLLKELDDCARAGIKDELASLDPLLRHVAVPEEAREGMFEFD